MILWNLKSFFSHLCWCRPFHLAFPDDVAYACTNIQRVAAKGGDTPHIDTWCNVMVWVDFFGVRINDKIHDVRERNVAIKIGI